MIKPLSAPPQATVDEEAPTTSAPPPSTNTTNSAIQPGSPMPPAITQPLRVDTLPKDFEPKPQTQAHYLTPEQAAEAGIEPPTPVLRAQAAEKQKESMAVDKEKEKQKSKSPALEPVRDHSPISPLDGQEGK